MLEKYTTTEYRDLYENLSKKIQSLFWDEDFSNRIAKITERFKLNKREEEKLMTLTAHIFLGVLPPSQISHALDGEIILDRDNTERLANEIIRFLVSPIQHLLREIYEDDDFKKVGIKNDFYQKTNTTNGDSYREPIV
jgi:hypothetical protein